MNESEEESNKDANKQKSDDEESTMDSSSEHSSKAENSEEENIEIYWVYPLNGCAVCETCLGCLAEKRCLNIHNCQRKKHAVPLDTKQFSHVEFYGASTDGFYRFFYECAGFLETLKELKGCEISANICKSCAPKVLDKIKRGIFF